MIFSETGKLMGSPLRHRAHRELQVFFSFAGEGIDLLELPQVMV
jgi:hypothetical protein